MTKAYSTLTVKSVTDTDDERIITGIATTPSTDRDDDILEPTGAKFALPIPLLWQHNHNQPIGEVISATVTDKGIEITAKIAKIADDGKLKDRLDEAWQSRVAKGVTFRVGNQRGKMVSQTGLVDVDSGYFIMTNKRFMFKGSKKSFAYTFKQLVGYTVYNDGMHLHSSRGATRLLRFMQDFQPDIVDLIANKLTMA